MSVETYPSAAQPEMSGLPPETIDEINSIAPFEKVTERSTGATNVLAAANRIADFFDARYAAKKSRHEARIATTKTKEMNTFHDEALKEYRERDHSDYVDHLAQLSDVQVDDNVIVTEQQQSYSQSALNRENRIEDRAEAIDQAKSKLKGFGRSALNLLHKTGRITTTAAITGFGAGLVASAAAGRSVKKGYDAAIDKGISVSSTLDNKVEGAFKFIDGKKVEYSNKIDNARLERKQAKELRTFDKQTEKDTEARAKVDRKEMKEAEKIDKRHDRILRGIQARERRAARREAFISAVSETYQGAKANILGNIQEAKGAGKEVLRYSKQRTRELGHVAASFISVAHEAGQTAVDTGRANWKTLREQDQIDRK